MNRKMLEDMGLTKEQVDAIMKENGENIEQAKESLNTQIEELTKERDGYKDQIQERDKQLDGLKKEAKDQKELQDQITKLQEDNKAATEAHKAEMKQLRIDNAVEKALTASGARNTKAVRALLDLDKAELAEDGTIKGLDAQLKTLKGAEDSKFLFSEKKVTIRGANPGEAGDIDPAGRETDPAKMSYEDFVAQAKENPEG